MATTKDNLEKHLQEAQSSIKRTNSEIALGRLTRVSEEKIDFLHDEYLRFLKQAYYYNVELLELSRRVAWE